MTETRIHSTPLQIARYTSNTRLAQKLDLFARHTAGLSKVEQAYLTEAAYRLRHNGDKSKDPTRSTSHKEGK